MNDYYLYILQSSSSLILLSSIYYLILKKGIHFHYNRIFILFSLIASFIIPLLDLSFIQNQALYTFQLAPFEIGGQETNTTKSTLVSTSNILLYLYLAGSMVLLFKLIRDSYLIYKIKIRSKLLINTNGQRIYLNNDQNFSFFKWIFIHELDEKNDTIIHHELKHQQMLHSFDIVLLKIFQILFWYHPLVFLLEKELRLQHEYAVDQAVLKQEKDKANYQQLLLNQAFEVKFNLITNSFNQSFLKNRFIMMTKKENKKLGRFLLMALLAAVFITPVLLSCSMEAKEEKTEITPAIEEKKTEEVMLEGSEVEDVFTVVEEMPTFPGGKQKMYEYIGQNLEYPADAKSAGIQGRVVVKFIIEKDGSIDNVRVIKGIGHGCDKAAMEVIKGMPNWIPGKQRGKNVKVEFALPLSFKLQ